jgi:hypothetical protein
MIQKPHVDCNQEEQQPTQAQTKHQYEPADFEPFCQAQPRAPNPDISFGIREQTTNAKAVSLLIFKSEAPFPRYFELLILN